MIISGGSRANWRFFASHLTNAKDNEKIRVIEFQSVTDHSVLDALREMDAVASGTRCRNFLYHADLNPREEERLTEEQWGQAVEILEKQLGLDGQPRFVVEHEKEGRVHRHVVWSRIDIDTMTARSDSHNYRKHELAAREIEQSFGLEPVASVLIADRPEPRPERRPKNWETFRGHKSGLDVEQVKADVSAVWQAADSGRAFAAGLAEKGYLLCQGDKRDFCLVDPAGDAHSLGRRLPGVKTAELRARLADVDRGSLPTVAEAREQATAWGSEDSEAASAVRHKEMDMEMRPFAGDLGKAKTAPEPGEHHAAWIVRLDERTPEHMREDRRVVNDAWVQYLRERDRDKQRGLDDIEPSGRG